MSNPTEPEVKPTAAAAAAAEEENKEDDKSRFSDADESTPVAAAAAAEKPSATSEEDSKYMSKKDNNRDSNTNEGETKEEEGKSEKVRDRAEDDTKEPSPKRSRTDTEQEEEEEESPEETVDLAVQLGLKPGYRLQVEWELLDPESDENGDEKTSTRWWGCSLLPHDGRTEDSVAIRTLDYDPYPEGGFPERSQEDVIFLSHELIMSPENQAEFRFRPEGVVQFSNEEETREAINEILMETMKKHAGKWSALTPAQQAAIADGIAQKKEQLVEAIMSHDKSPIIGPDDMKEILSGIMR